MTCFYCFIRTYFKSEEAPLCRIEFQLITISHGDGISPKLSKNLHKVRQVGTLPAAKTSSVGKAATFPKREGSDLFRRQSRHLPRKGRQSPLPSVNPPPSPKGKAFCRERPILFQGKLQRFLYSLKSCEFISLSCFSCFSCLFQLT